MQDKTVGILGGMGPEATVDLMDRIIKSTPATDDLDHIRVVVDNNPKVPSRIKALIEKTGADPIPCLKQMAQKLESWGVDFLAIPCNTAHYCYPEIEKAVNIPILNMIDLTVKKVLADQPEIKLVGILASTAVLNLRLYESYFADHQVNVLCPSEELQNKIMQAIRSVKCGQYKDETKMELQAATDDLIQKGAEVLIIACTELSVVSNWLTTSRPSYDTAQILAESIVQLAKGKAQSATSIQR